MSNRLTVGSVSVTHVTEIGDSGRKPLRLSGWLVAVAVLVVMAVALHPLPAIDVPLSVHAVESHGMDAERAKQCLDGREGMTFFNPSMNRWAIVCWLEDRWGIVILSAILTVITAFVCMKRRSAEKVREYMERQGYQER